MTPTDENESWISIVPPSVDRADPTRGCRRGRRVAVGAVDVQHVDRAVDRRRARRRRTSARACTRSATPAAVEVGEEHLVVVGGLGGEAVDLLRARGRCRRADRSRRPRRRRARRRRQHDRRAAPEAADLDDLPAGGTACGRVVQRRRLAGRHPAVDVGDERHHRRQVGPSSTGRRSRRTGHVA